eukprot:768291-Hanusia_phi.AAC.7
MRRFTLLPSQTLQQLRLEPDQKSEAGTYQPLVTVVDKESRFRGMRSWLRSMTRSYTSPVTLKPVQLSLPEGL